MTNLYRIAMLWVEGPLSYLEQLCIRSFLDAGHEVTLYHYGPVANVPDGVVLMHGDAILQRDEFIQHGKSGSLALFSDVFRYHLLTQCDRTIWADTDAYCMKPFETETGHYFGWESAKHINGGVLGLPQDSPALAGLLEMSHDEYATPEWYSDALKARLKADGPVHVSELPWGTWGPIAVTHYLHKTGEAKHALARDVLYPVPYARRRSIVRPERRAKAEGFLTENTASIHLYGRRMRAFLAKREGGMPDKGGLMDHLLQKHGIDPQAAPLPPYTPIADPAD